ncbi:MAG: hypothetical protein JW765_11695 [Deltaproteobacteria bacterium]|nr:hypothetical protein [Candidatus Zymogenaceae bacterium]
MKNRRFRIVLWFCFWLTLITAAGQYLLSAGFPFRFSSLEPYLLRKENDDWTHNAFVMQDLKNRIRTDDSRDFVFIGSSTSLEAITEDSLVNERLLRLTRRQTRFTSLCSSLMTFSDEIKIVDELGDINCTLLIGIEPLRFKYEARVQLEQPLPKYTSSKYYYLSTNSALVAILSDYGFSTPITERFSLFRSATAFGEIVKKQLSYMKETGGEIEYTIHNRHAVGEKKPVSEKDRERLAQGLTNALKRYTEEFDMNYRLLEKEIDIAASNGNRIILVDLPFNPLFQDEMDQYYPVYNEKIKDLVNEKGIEYLDMRTGITLVAEDFRDFHHMRHSGRIRFTEALADYLAGYMN